MQGAGGKVEESMQDEEGYLQKGKGRVKSSTRKSDPQNEGKGERAGR